MELAIFKRINPFAPGDFTKKRVLKLVEWFSGLLCNEELQLTTKLFTGRTIHGLLMACAESKILR